MQQLFETCLAFVQENWPRIVTFASAAIASFLAGRAARKRWKSREFLHRLNVSLTTIDGGILKIRTILEMECDDIFLNRTASKQIVRFAKQTTLEDPVLPIPPDDCWQYLNAVLNEISERFAEGQVRRDLGLPVERGAYLLCLTREAAGNVRTQKIRCLMTQKKLLTKLPTDVPKFESQNHTTRWQTLHQLATQYEAAPHRFLEIEICL